MISNTIEYSISANYFIPIILEVVNRYKRKRDKEVNSSLCISSSKILDFYNVLFNVIKY